MALNYFSMDFSLVTPTTNRMINFLIIKVFNLQQNDCKYTTEMIWKLSMCLERILLHDLRYGMHKLLDTSYGKTVTKEIVSLNMDKVLLSTNCVLQVTYQISFTKSQSVVNRN